MLSRGKRLHQPVLHRCSGSYCPAGYSLEQVARRAIFPAGLGLAGPPLAAAVRCRPRWLPSLLRLLQAAIRTASKTCAGYLYTANDCAATALETTANFTNAGAKTPSKWVVAPAAGSDAYNIYTVRTAGVFAAPAAELLCCHPRSQSACCLPACAETDLPGPGCRWLQHAALLLLAGLPLHAGLCTLLPCAEEAVCRRPQLRHAAGSFV